MAENRLLKELEQRLKAKNIYDIRQIARGVGVQSPTAGKKERLLKDILDIAAGLADPAPHSTKGAPPKSEEYDRNLVSDILRCREISLSEVSDANTGKENLSVSSNEYLSDTSDVRIDGLLEKSGDKWFMRTEGCREDDFSDVLVKQSFIEKYDLRQGDIVGGACKRSSSEGITELTGVISVNGISAAALMLRRKFENLTPVYPDRRFKLERGQKDVINRMLDLFSPVGAGQRALITTPRGSAKKEVIKELADGISHNQPNTKIIFVLIDAGAEEIADYQHSFPSADIFASPMNMSAACHVRTANLALEYAKRLTEYSSDVVLILDDINRLVRAFGKHVSNVPEPAAFDGVKKYLSAARNAKEGGSLTLVSAISSDSGDPADEAVYFALKDTFTMKIVISQSLVRRRLSSPVDVLSSGAFAEKALLSPEELSAADKLRNIVETSDAETCVKMFENTVSNAELCAQINKSN